MSMNLVVLLYLVASVCFIQALKGLSHPTTSRRGNVFGMVGMLIAIVTTVALILKLQGAAGTQSNGAGIALVIFGPSKIALSDKLENKQLSMIILILLLLEST